MATKFVSVNLTPAARDALRIESLRISLEVGRKVSMADALVILATVAKSHPDAVSAEARRLYGIPDPTTTPSTEEQS